MKKDKDWAQNEVDRYLSYEGVNEARNALVFAKGVIDQLDELEVTLDEAFEKVAETYPMTKEEVWRHIERYGPHAEVLTEEWLEENKCSWYKLKVDGYYISVEKLQNLLLPEPELPVIPKFVADYINRIKKRGNGLDGAFTYIKAYGWDDETSYEYEVYKWLDIGSNDETFARAWLDGYEVEEEQKYILSINITDKASKTNYETFLNKRGIFHSMENESFNSEEFSWTEEEIKGLENGEILFEHFATKIEELEE